MDNDKLKLYLDFAKFFLGTFLIAIITFIVKSGFESREIAIKESEQIGKYVEIALREDIGVRKRFAEYFKTVTISDRYRNRWTNYYELVRGEFDIIKQESVSIDKEIDSLKNLVGNLQDSSNSMTEDYLYKIDELTKEKAVLEEELQVNPEEVIPETYQIVMLSLKSKPKIKEVIKNYIDDQGFKLNRDVDYDTGKSWLAEKPTVMYYSNISRFAAKNIASDLQQLTGINFRIKLSTETEAQRRQDYNFAIHYIN